MLVFHQNLVQHLEAIEDCLEKRRILPCLCLLYSAIDVVASLERVPREGTKAAFIRWVDENMLKTRPMPCTALDLYASRCVVLHTFTADSDLSRDGSARRITYAWGNAKPEDLAKAAKLLGRTEVAVHIRGLIDGFRMGLASYLEAVVHSPERLRRIEESASLWFTHMEQDVVERFLNASSGRETNG